MKVLCAAVLALATLAGGFPVRAQSIASNAPSAATSADKSKARDITKLLLPRAPVMGQPFDDREIELYLELESRKLMAASRVHPLRFDHRSCTLQLPEPPKDKLTSREIAARAEAATLVLGEFSKDGKKKDLLFSAAGGGFIVDGSGICLTSLHVAKDKDARGFCAMTRDGRVFPVREILAYEPVNDLAFFQLDLPPGVTLPSLALAHDPAPIGSPIFVMSHPDDRFYLLSAGFVARHTLWRTSAGDQAFMTITADFAKGSSGCPVLDECGAVVGIVNNTESIYYDDDGHKKQTDLQMVVKNATPSWAVRPMLENLAGTSASSPTPAALFKKP